MAKMTKTVQALIARYIVVLLFVLAGVSSPGPVLAAESDVYTSTPVAARLITAQDGISPDTQTLSAGLHLKLAEDWKTYWRSPGEVGIPPSIDWVDSTNIKSVEFLWPAPKRFRAFGIENFGYKKEVVFPLQIVLENPGQPATLNGQVFLLVCSDVCVPENFTLTLELGPGNGTDFESAALIGKYAALVPDDGSLSGLGLGEASINEDSTKLTVTFTSDRPFDTPDVFPDMGPYTSFGVPDIRVDKDGKTLWAQFPILSAAENPDPLRITITDLTRSADFDATLTDKAPSPPYKLASKTVPLSELMWIALVAVLGGLILNVMPCVLPVLSIKFSSAMKVKGQSPARVRAGFLASALGVFSFMWLLALGTIIARWAGLSVGWGLQFQNPVFLIVMFVVLAVFSANLFGLFEISLPQSWNSRLARPNNEPSIGGDYATGAFAAVLATPCSAPFLGTAVAFALSGRPIDIFVIFTALGLGLAMPYLAIAIWPRLVSKIPKPGKWMVLVKIVLGGLLALTAVWLVWVLKGVAGREIAIASTALVLAAILLLWMGRSLPLIIRSVGLVALTAGAISTPLAIGATPQSETLSDKEVIAWVDFDRVEIAKAVSQGKVVFVDVTADWCLTCKANKALVIDRSVVAGALNSENIIPMRADWTRPSEVISRYLEDNGRFGIPFNIVYGPAAPEGIPLPEILTTDLVMEALAKAGADLLALES